MILDSLLIFSSYLPHRSGKNTTQNSRRALYMTYNGESDCDYRKKYYEDKRKNYPPENEKDPKKDYSVGSKIYNVGTPVTF